MDRGPPEDDPFRSNTQNPRVKEGKLHFASMEQYEEARGAALRNDQPESQSKTEKNLRNESDTSVRYVHAGQKPGSTIDT